MAPKGERLRGQKVEGCAYSGDPDEEVDVKVSTAADNEGATCSLSTRVSVLLVSLSTLISEQL